MCAFHGQMGMFVRALAYMLSHGARRRAAGSEDAVLSANYILASLKDVMSAPSAGPACMKRCSTIRSCEDTGVTTLDFAKAMIDEGYPSDDDVFPAGRPWRHADRADGIRIEGKPRPLHPCAAQLAAEAKAGKTERFEGAPHLAPRRRLDETAARANPVLRWKPKDLPQSSGIRKSPDFRRGQGFFVPRRPKEFSCRSSPSFRRGPWSRHRRRLCRAELGSDLWCASDRCP